MKNAHALSAAVLDRCARALVSGAYWGGLPPATYALLRTCVQLVREYSERAIRRAGGLAEVRSLVQRRAQGYRGVEQQAGLDHMLRLQVPAARRVVARLGQQQASGGGSTRRSIVIDRASFSAEELRRAPKTGQRVAAAHAAHGAGPAGAGRAYRQ